MTDKELFDKDQVNNLFSELDKVAELFGKETNTDGKGGLFTTAIKYFKRYIIINIILSVYVASSWYVNTYRFCTCDFDAPYKAEIVYGIGVVGVPSFLLTSWMDIDN